MSKSILHFVDVFSSLSILRYHGYTRKTRRRKKHESKSKIMTTNHLTFSNNNISCFPRF